jgi:hypothetical protein
MMKLGLSSGWCSSTVSVSPPGVIFPEASRVGDDWDTVPPGASRSRGAASTRTGTAYKVILVSRAVQAALNPRYFTPQRS